MPPHLKTNLKLTWQKKPSQSLVDRGIILVIIVLFVILPERVGGDGGGCIRPGSEKLLVWHDELFHGVMGGVLGLEGHGLLHLEGLLPELPVTVVNWPRPETNVHLDVLKERGKGVKWSASDCFQPLLPV